MRSVAKRAAVVASTAVARAQLIRMRATGESSAIDMAAALGEALKNHLSAEEQRWVDKIEALRSDLKGSTTRIPYTDYGAGTSNTKIKNASHGSANDISIGQACLASKSYFWSLLLFKIIRRFKPDTALELGTCLGISAAYQASAQKINKTGTMTTVEGAASLLSLARKNLQLLDLDNVCVVAGRFQDVLDDVLRELGPVEYAFIDGHHDEGATLAYFEKMNPHLSDRSILIFDDISWSNGMKRAWKRIRESRTVKISLDLGVIGICIMDVEMNNRHSFAIPLPGRS